MLGSFSDWLAMTVILDENLPRGLKRLLTDIDVSTVQESGWSGISNGDLIARADGRFDVLLTADKNLRYQQNLSARQIAIVELPSNRWPDLKAMAQQITDTLRTVEPGSYRFVQPNP